jgi:putative FmdB family regulatory protein
MPIYEFYCPGCHTIFNFLSRRIDTRSCPPCPSCKRRRLERQVSLFASIGQAGEPGDGDDDLPVDDARLERAMESLAREAEGMNEDDPRQAANMIRKLSESTGMELGDGMQEALRRLEAGEDPEAIESEMGDVLENEDPFQPGGARGRGARRAPPKRDSTLYEM